MPSMLREHGLAIAICFGGELLFYLLYQHIKHTTGTERACALCCKAAATLFAAALAWYGAALRPGAPELLLALGLTVCAAADVLLRLNFLWGMACFGAGHLLYSAAYVLATPPGWTSLGAFAVLAVFCLLRYPGLKKYAGKKNPLPYLGYALLLCVMLSLALPQKPVLLAGAALFVVSDSLLARRIMLKIQSNRYDDLCLGVYYLAQFLIALSLLT